MANVMQAPIDFHVRPVGHAPSAIGFGFGLSSSSTMPQSAGWQPPHTSPHYHPSPFQASSNNSNLQSSSRSKKRSLEDDGFDSRYSQDDPMENRSPTPESRPKKAAPKRARVTTAVESSSKESKGKDGRTSDGNDIDVGVLLASLPPESLLPMLMSLIEKQPALKPLILQLIPRPTVAAAIRVLDTAAKQLSDAYPYSSSSSPGSTFSTLSWSPAPAGFGQASSQNNRMRDGYIQSRIRPQCTEFLSTYLTYLPYFSCAPNQPALQSHPSPQASHSSMLQSLHKDKIQPSETVMFLSSFTRHIISQPILSQDLLLEEAGPRLVKEWMAWVEFIDSYMNRHGGMFASSEMSKWMRMLDELVQARQHERLSFLKATRDKLVGVVGVYIDQQPMQI